MIKSVKIKNFQAHKKSELILHKGINVTTGVSDSGKSSVIRALRWLFDNRPSGDAFIRNGENVAEVIIEMDETKDIISRYKTKTENGYKVNGETLKAIRGDVPDEVKDILNISGVNLQSQHDPYFLLTETPGQVAKQFNELAGLEIMDEMLKLVNSKARNFNREYDESIENENKLANNIQSLNWVDVAQKKVDEIKVLHNEIKETDNSIITLNKFILAIDKLEDQIAQEGDFTELEKEIDSLLKLQKEINDLQENFAILKSLIIHAESAKESMDFAFSKIVDYQKQYDTLKEELGICPLCERPWK